MLALQWSVRSPLTATALADRIRAEPRWDGWRDGFANGRFLIAERYPVEAGPEGFSFVVPSSQRMFIACRGWFHGTEGGTWVDLRATPQLVHMAIVGIMSFLFVCVFVIGLWSVNPWLAVGLGLVGVSPGLLLFALGFWMNARRVRTKVTEFLTRDEDKKTTAEPGTAPGGG